jgi:hypothetical protein
MTPFMGASQQKVQRLDENFARINRESHPAVTIGAAGATGAACGVCALSSAGIRAESATIVLAAFLF